MIHFNVKSLDKYFKILLVFAKRTNFGHSKRQQAQCTIKNRVLNSFLGDSKEKLA